MKLLWGAVLIIALVMAAIVIVVDHRQREAIVEEFQRRGEVLARSLAAISQGPLLLYNFTALEQNVARVGAEADVVYAIVLDADGKVAAHSRRPERIGVLPVGAVAERAARAESTLIQDTTAPDTGEPAYDFAVPVFVDRQKWGTVRVGLSKRRMDAEIRKTAWELGGLALVTLLLGGVAAALVARRIAGPVQELEQGAVAIARGELNQRIEPRSADEIGRLAIAFNHMATQLFQQRAALEEVHSELKHRFEELADLKSYTDSILASLTSGIVTVDLDGRVVTLNPAAELLTGFFAGEVAGRYCTEVFAHTLELGDILMETLTSRAPIASVPLTLRRRNGAGCPVELSTAPLKGGDGKDLGAVAVLRDLTVVRQLETQLRRSDQLAALGTLAAGLAHEIKNPLTSLLTFSRHLGRKFDDEHFRERFQSVVPRELERINEIVERLLELARPARLNLTLVRLPALLDRVLELHANQIEAKQIAPVRQYARDVPPVQADEEGLYQVLVNLVGNALDAMEGRGRLILRLGWSEAGSRPARRVFNRRVLIEIEDTGSGIPPSESDRVFTPFFTTKPGGTGLGLAITHKIVEDHGGSIDFRSVPGVGTTFRVVLPLVAEPVGDLR
ncbi:MAG: HAMP domain-containing protein [Candidatus Rokubacteria bacterium]|nr:HAMP domain-containing protein [Candidatus Rokubacteria bacterium]